MKVLNKFFINLPGESSVFPLTILIQGLLFMLGLWGCLAIYNATMYAVSPFYFVGRQLLWLVFGMGLMMFCARIPFSVYRDNVELLTVLFYIPLLAVLIFGVRINGMKGWFMAGNIFIQPSELAKGFFILSLCHFGGKLRPGMQRFAGMALITLLWVLPIALQPDFGTVLVYIAGFVIVYWLMNGSFWHLLLVPATLFSIAGWLINFNPYLLNRVLGYLVPELDPLGFGWHIRQFQFTLARGGLWGMKWGKALWANSYLPLAHSDSVFASLAESLGFIGTFPLIIVMGILVFAVFKLSLKAETDFRKVFVLSIGLLFAVQALIHISVNVTLMPATGITLPILSYGGSSLLSTLISFGIMLSAAGRHETISSSKVNYNQE